MSRSKDNFCTMKPHVKTDKTNMETDEEEEEEELHGKCCESRRGVMEFSIFITLMAAVFVLTTKCTATKNFALFKFFNISLFMSTTPTQESSYGGYLYNEPFDQFLQESIGEERNFVQSFSISKDALKSALDKKIPKKQGSRIFTRHKDNERRPANSEKVHSTIKTQVKCDISPVDHRFDCYPEDGATESKCVARGCCWQKEKTVKKSIDQTSVPLNVPFCYYPTNYPGYYVTSKTSILNSGDSIVLERNSSSYYPDDIMQLRFEVTYETNYRLRVKVSFV